MRDFKKLKIWQNAMALADKLYDSSRFFPDEERFGLKSQCTRACVSIPSNIAEGSAKKSEKDYVRFMEMALGSCFELETQLLIIKKRNWLPEEDIDELLDLTVSEQKMISKFIDKLA